MDEHLSKSIRANISELKSLRCTFGLSGEALNALAAASVKRTYAARETIWKIGDPGEFIAIITSGSVEITRHAGSDEEMTVGVFGPSDVIGISAVIQKKNYPGNAKILTSGTGIIKCYIRPILNEKKEFTPEIQTWVREMLLLHEQILRDKIDIMNAGSAELRVFELLKHLVRRFGRHETPVKHFVPIHLTRAQIGNLVHIRTETIIRLISRWKKEKLIDWSADGIKIENMTLLEKSLSKNKRLK